jgi:sugar phosphate isomerase/epimerase
MKKISLDEIKDRMSVSTIVFYNYAPLDLNALNQIAEAGVRKIELLESPEQFNMSDMGSMRYIFDMCKKAGIKITAYHSHFVEPTGIESREKLDKLIDDCKRQLETLQEAGGNIWASHARGIDSSVCRLYEELLRFVEGTNLKLAVENFFKEGTLVQDRLEFLREFDHPQLGLVLDIGHVRENGVNLMILEGEPTRILHECAKKLFHLHLHGFKDGHDHYPPRCEGDIIRWEEIFINLKEIGYNGYFNFESKGLPKHKDTLLYVSKMPEYIYEVMAKN